MNGCIDVWANGPSVAYQAVCSCGEILPVQAAIELSELSLLTHFDAHKRQDA